MSRHERWQPASRGAGAPGRRRGSNWCLFKCRGDRARIGVAGGVHDAAWGWLGPAVQPRALGMEANARQGVSAALWTPLPHSLLTIVPRPEPCSTPPQPAGSWRQLPVPHPSALPGPADALHMSGAPARRRAAALETARPGAAAPPPTRPLAAANPAGAAKALTKEELVRWDVPAGARCMLSYNGSKCSSTHSMMPPFLRTGSVCPAAQGRAGAGARGARRTAPRRQAGRSQQVSGGPMRP